MNANLFKMSFEELGICLLIGGICGAVFMYLLWRTVKLLPQVKHKYLFIFVSKLLRIFLLFCVMVLFSDHHAGKFLAIFCGFLIVRLFVLRFVHFRVYHDSEEKQLMRGMRKK